MNNHVLPTWKLLGFEQRAMENVLLFTELSMDRWWNGPPDSPDAMDYWASNAVCHAFAAFAAGAMGYIHPRPPLDDWRDLGRRCIAAAICYFAGAWREEFGQARARAELHWSDYYREGLTAAASFSDWPAVDQLLKWPGSDLPLDEGTDDRTKEDNAYQIWLASRLRGEPPDACKQQRAMVDGGSRRRPKMLMEAADALLANDAGALAQALERYLKYYRKQELRTNRIDFGIAADANTLWHLARRRGLGEIPLSSEAMLLIARP